MWISDKWQDFELIDCSKGEKLERWGRFYLVRPDPQAIWDTPRSDARWNMRDARYRRSQTGGGMTDLQIRTSKTTTQTANKLRNVEYSEENVRSNIQALYDEMEEKNASYTAAKTAYESGQIAWQAAQIQKANGMLSNIQYMQQELAWLQAQSGYKCADLALQQALQNYKWAVAGVSVSADTH